LQNRKTKRVYNKNYCIDSDQILHSDKDHQRPSLVVLAHASQIQDGGRPPSWKNQKIAISFEI